MSDFDNLEKKAEEYVKKHPEQAEKPVDQAAGLAGPETDHQHDKQIDRAVDAADEQRGDD